MFVVSKGNNNNLKIKIMTATFTLTKKTALEELIQRNNNSEKQQMIEIKTKAMKDALENAEFYASIGNKEFADNEASRARLLERQIRSLL